MDQQSELMGLLPRWLYVSIFPAFFVTSPLLLCSFLCAVIFPMGCGTRDPFN